MAGSPGCLHFLASLPGVLATIEFDIASGGGHTIPPASTHVPASTPSASTSTTYRSEGHHCWSAGPAPPLGGRSHPRRDCQGLGNAFGLLLYGP